MFSQNFAIYASKIIVELVGSILYFPLWWYSRGLLLTIKGLNNFIIEREKGIGLSIWVKNLFKPMYGQRDWVGKAISFFMRLVQIIVRSLIMLFWIMLALLFLAFWVLLPPLVVMQMIYQII
jgi:hypothetical protein